MEENKNEQEQLEQIRETAVSAEEDAVEETTAEAAAEETPAEAAAEEVPAEVPTEPAKKATPGKIAMAVGTVILLAAVLILPRIGL